MSKAFSVIIPSFNRAYLLPMTLDSVLAQNLAPSEIIVVDDGSTDNTDEVVNQYRSHVRLIKIDNSGVAAARHEGVMASSCDFIAFCDSDDVWRADHLQTMDSVLDSDTVRFAFSNFQYIKDDEWTADDRFSHAPAGYWRFSDNRISEDVAIVATPLYPHLFEFQPIFPSCTAMARSFYDQVGGYKKEFGFLPSEDLEFTLRCTVGGSVGIVFKPTVGQRIHARNHSALMKGSHFAKVARQYHGETTILKYSRDHHQINPAWRESLDREIIKRSSIGFDLAFASGEFSLAQLFSENIPLHSRSLKFHVKKTIMSLPEQLAMRLTHKLVS